METSLPASRSPSLPHLIRRDLPLLHQGRTNDCGPYALTMALRALGWRDLNAQAVSTAMWPFRVPGIGATTPRAVWVALARLGATGHGGWFGQIADLQRAVDRGVPSLVIVRPTDFRRTRWFDLHYRVVVGFEDSLVLPGGGQLFFACSSSPDTPIAGGNGLAPANVAVDYREFARQWRTWAAWRWYVTLDERRDG